MSCVLLAHSQSSLAEAYALSGEIVSICHLIEPRKLTGAMIDGEAEEIKSVDRERAYGATT